MLEIEGMQQWSPDKLFYVTLAISALGGVGALLSSSKKLTVRSLIGDAIKYGCLGAGCGAFVYNFFGGRKAPELVVAVGGLVGAGAIKLKDITAVVRRAFNIPDGSPKNQTKDNDNESGSDS